MARDDYCPDYNAAYRKVEAEMKTGAMPPAAFGFEAFVREQVPAANILAAYRDLEAAVRAWLADFDNRYDGESLPNLQEINALKAALAALDRVRSTSPPAAGR